MTLTARDKDGGVNSVTTTATINTASTTDVNASLLFDFGYKSPVASGAIPVDLTSYSPTRGYGWVTYGVGGDWGGTNPLTRDSNWGSNNTFLVDVPDGTYTVAPILRNVTSQTAVMAEGQVVAATSLSNFQVNVTDGQLTLNFQNYNLAGLTIAGVNLSRIGAGSDQVVDEGKSVRFTGHAFTAVGSTFTWDFGDGTMTSGTLTPVHTYQDNGTYTATLTAKDPSGNVIQDTAKVTVKNVAPTPNAQGPYASTSAAPIAFKATAIDPSSVDTASGFTFTWDFGDGTTGTGATPSHAYAKTGTYDVTLTARDKDGGVNTASITATVTAYDIAPSFKTPYDSIPNFAVHPSNISVRSGVWSDPKTWSTGHVPTDGDIVSIAGGTNVTYDVVSTAHLNTVTVQAASTLTFRTDKSTEIIVGNFEVNPGGTLIVGTPSNPIQSDVRVQIIIADQAIDLANDPQQFGTGLIVLGNVTMSGSPMSSTFVRLATEPKAGDTTLVLSQPVTGWHVGSHLYLPDTRQLAWNQLGSNYVSQNEHPVIAGISADGTVLTLAFPLQFDHLGARDGNGVLDYLPHVANLSRNVMIESENPNGTRGHVLFANRANVDIRYVGFCDLGRTLNAPIDNTTFDSSGNVTHIGTNQMARYAFHLHHVIGPEQTPDDGYQFTVIGNVMENEDSQPSNLKWGLTIHDSSYGLIQDNIIDNVAGAGIVTEAGSEIHNVIAHNFVAEVHGTGIRIDTDGNAGTGFWLRGPDNYVRSNVATNLRGGDVYSYGFNIFARYLGTMKVPAYPGADPTISGQSLSVNMNATPLLDFSNNEVYGASPNGMTYWWLGSYYLTDLGPAGVIKDFHVWNQYNWGIFGYESNDLTIDGFVGRGSYPIGELTTGLFFSDYMQRNLTITHADIQGMRTGIDAPAMASGTVNVNNSYLRNITDVAVSTMWSTNGPVLPARLIKLTNVRFDTPAGSPLNAISMNYLNRGYGTNLIQQDQVFVFNYNGVIGDDFQVLYNQQASSFIIPQSSTGMIGAPVAGLTNQQAWDQYGLAIAGAVAPDMAKKREGIRGLCVSI